MLKFLNLIWIFLLLFVTWKVNDQFDKYHPSKLVIAYSDNYAGCGYQVTVDYLKSAKASPKLSILNEIQLPITAEQFNKDCKHWVEICRQLGKIPFWDKSNKITHHYIVPEVHFVYPKEN